MNYYEILGISQTDDMNLIKQAYKHKVKKLHPDKNIGNNTTEQFLLVQKAYEVLNDPEEKSKYDKNLTIIINRKEINEKRKQMINELKKKEKESKNEKMTNNKDNTYLNIKRNRYYQNIELQSNSNNINKNILCLLVEFKHENKIDLNKEMIKSYFKEYGLIEHIIIDTINKKCYIKYQYNNNIDETIEYIKKNNSYLMTLFHIKKHNWNNININKIEKNNITSSNQKLHSNAKNIISSSKIIDYSNNKFNNLTLEELENEIFG